MTHWLAAFAPGYHDVIGDMIRHDGKVITHARDLGTEFRWDENVRVSTQLKETGLTKFARMMGKPFYAVDSKKGVWVCMLETPGAGIDMYICAQDHFWTVCALLPERISDLLVDPDSCAVDPSAALEALYDTGSMVTGFARHQLKSWLKQQFTEQYREVFRPLFSLLNPFRLYSASIDIEPARFADPYGYKRWSAEKIMRETISPDRFIITFGFVTFGFSSDGTTTRCYIFDDGESKMYTLNADLPGNMSLILKNAPKPKAEPETPLSVVHTAWRYILENLVLDNGHVHADNRWLIRIDDCWASDARESMEKFESVHQGNKTRFITVEQALYMFVETGTQHSELYLFDMTSGSLHKFEGEILANFDTLFSA